jgi:hypothetical protein
MDISVKIQKGVVFMIHLFTTLKGLQIILGTLTLIVNVIIFANTVTEMPGKGNS